MDEFINKVSSRQTISKQDVIEIEKLLGINFITEKYDIRMFTTTPTSVYVIEVLELAYDFKRLQSKSVAEYRTLDDVAAILKIKELYNKTYPILTVYDKNMSKIGKKYEFNGELAILLDGKSVPLRSVSLYQLIVDNIGIVREKVKDTQLLEETLYKLDIKDPMLNSNIDQLMGGIKYLSEKDITPSEALSIKVRQVTSDFDNALINDRLKEDHIRNKELILRLKSETYHKVLILSVLVLDGFYN